MRVTNHMMIQNMLNDLYNNTSRMSKYQRQLSTGKKISRPSDDPVRVANSLRLRSKLSENEQYRSNVEDATSYLQLTDTALQNINSVYQRVRELAVRGASGSLSAEDQKAIADEITQLREQIGEEANTTYQGKYIFNGKKTQTPVFKDNDLNSDSDSSAIEYEIATGIDIPVNVTASEFLGDDKNNIFKTMDDLVTALNNGDSLDISAKIIPQLDERMQLVSSKLSEVGARTNRLEMTNNRIDDLKTNFTDLLSQNEDADMAEVIMNLKTEESVYRASLSAGSQVIQPSLLDFLK